MKNILKIPHYKILSGLLFATLVSAAALALVIYNLDPYTSTGLALSLFFLSFSFTVAGIFTMTLFLLKKWKAQDHIYVKHVMISLRQGIVLSLLVSTCLLLLILGLLRIWNGLLLVIFIVMLEYHLSARDELS